MLKYFTVADRWVELVSRWGSFSVLLAAFLTWLASRTKWLGALNLAELVVVGMAGTLVTILVISTLLTAIGVYRSRSAVGNALATDDAESDRPQIQMREIERRLETLIEQRFAAIEPDLTRFRQHLEKIEHIEWHRRLRALKEKLAPIDMPKAFIPNIVVEGTDRERGLTATMSEMVALGFPDEIVKGRVETAAARIRGDAMYTQVPAAEAERWRSADERRRWHIHNASIAALRDIAENWSKYVEEPVKVPRA